jgi:3-oxoadipate enol-lactonase
VDTSARNGTRPGGPARQPAPAAAPGGRRSPVTGVAELPGGVRLAYQDTGGGPPVVCVNNFQMLRNAWDPLVAELAPCHRVVTYDLRNQGDSHPGVGELRFADHVADLDALLDRLGIGAAYLVGTSISTLLVAELALARPRRVAGLVLACPAFSPTGRFRRELVSRSWLDLLERGGPEALFDHTYPLIFSDGMVHSGGRTRYRLARDFFLARFPVEALRANLRSALEPDDSPERLAAIGCPILLVLGDGDFLWSGSMAKQACRLFPDCRSVTLPGTGHLPYLDDPAGFASAVAGFVAECEGRATRPAAVPTPADGSRRDRDGRMDVDRREHVAGELRALLEEAVGGPVPLDEPGGRQASLWHLGLTSVGFIALLSAVEQRFGISWGLDEPVEAFGSFDALVDHVLANARALPDGEPRR